MRLLLSRAAARLSDLIEGIALRILFVAMANSIHTARWICQVSGQGWDLHLFPVHDPVAEDSPPHSELRRLTIHDAITSRGLGLDPSIRLRSRFWPFLRCTWPFPRGETRIQRVHATVFPSWRDRTRRLAHAIQRIQPDLIHSLEFQRSAYLTLEAIRHLGERLPPWIVTNWGSDIYLFGRLDEHVDRIKAVLSACDYYLCECQRDVGLAQSFGFRGEFLPIVPNAGGFDIERIHSLIPPGPTSARRTILLKGYQNWAGRALVGLQAIKLCADLLKGYRVALYLAGPDVRIAAELVAKSTGIPFDTIPPCSHEDILRLHGQARISIGLSISDAVSTSMLEAMLMGSFPIQSNTSCANEWIQCGTNGFLVDPEDPQGVAAAIRRAVTDDQLVDHAAEVNADVTAKRLDRSLIEPQVIAMYERVAANGRQHVSPSATGRDGGRH